MRVQTTARHSTWRFALSILALTVLPGSGMAQGPLAPTAVPAPSMRTLDQIANAAGGAVTLIRQSDLPISISQPGSYALAEYILYEQTNTTAITVTASPVTIDLNGFALRGPGELTGASGHGIFADVEQVTVLNGLIRDWRGSGVNLGSNSTVRGVVSRRNGGDGINVGPGSLVVECIVDNNEVAGFRLGDGSSLLNSTGRQSDRQGAVAGHGCRIIRCAFDNNGFAGSDEHGLETGSNCVISATTSRFNRGDGIRAGAGSIIRSCTMGENEMNGLMAGSGCRVSGNVSNDNGGDGILLTGNCRAEGNVCVANFGVGIRAQNPLNVLLRNVCNQNNSFIAEGIVIENDNTYSSQNYLGANFIVPGGSTEGSGDLANVPY